MDCPELYINANSLQRIDAKDVLERWIGKMIWKSNEIVLDLGCGPGDVTSDILYPFLKNKIELLVAVDKSKQMVEFAKRNYGCSKINFKVLDIENVNDCTFNSCGFNKIFSFYCLHWIQNKLDALVNMHLMLKNSGEILVYFLLVNPVVELYKCMDEEWKKYVPDIIQKAQTIYSEEEVKLLFIKAGFKVISIESSIKKHTYPDFTSFLSN
ncbi:Hypothetical protein CINCED_3A022699 [Cinara cedri]|uniref:Methyltransferase domain-containing protein n=1 Tax=Cinara cedri TaxID=506608 RepID=A0A5E4MCL3_9HEMI|nr:Hypothetical protein CINCED_3A022699 [Cinara cedri]